MTDSGGQTTFQFNAAPESSSTAYDTIVGFTASRDFFDLPANVSAVTAIDAQITTGTLNSGNFNSDIQTAVASIANGHAVIFTPDAGDFSGATFLIVNVDGSPGYQANNDFVFRLDSPDLTNFGTGNFI